MSVAQDAPGVVLGLARLFFFHHTGDSLVSKLDAGDGKAVLGEKRHLGLGAVKRRVVVRGDLCARYVADGGGPLGGLEDLDVTVSELQAQFCAFLHNEVSFPDEGHRHFHPELVCFSVVVDHKVTAFQGHLAATHAFLGHRVGLVKEVLALLG